MHLAISITNPIQQEARQILDSLAFTPFAQCHPLNHDFYTIPAKVGLYAFRHRIQGLLYIGKANNLRDRLRKVALMEKATQLECSLEIAIEMAIASFLASEAFSFEDCLL